MRRRPMRTDIEHGRRAGNGDESEAATFKCEGAAGRVGAGLFYKMDDGGGRADRGDNNADDVERLVVNRLSDAFFNP